MTGPFPTEEAYRITDEHLYVGRLVQDRKGQWCFLAFRNDDEHGDWIGEITDPQPVAVGRRAASDPGGQGESCPTANYYDVTQWPVGDRSRTSARCSTASSRTSGAGRRSPTDDGGKPGAVIYMPPGRLPPSHTGADRHQLPADRGRRARIHVVEHPVQRSRGRVAGSARAVARRQPHPRRPCPRAGRGESRARPSTSREAGARGSARSNSSNFCIDGLHFTSDGSELHPENTYVNGKTGIYVANANDSFRVNGMGFVYLEHALTIYNADALSIHDNFIAECGSCIELRGWGQASKITDNLIGAGFKGHSIYAENHGGLLITANNIFPRGASSVHLSGVTRSSVTQQPAALVLPRDGRTGGRVGEPGGLQPLPARPRALDALPRRQQRTRRRLRAAHRQRQ